MTGVTLLACTTPVAQGVASSGCGTPLAKRRPTPSARGTKRTTNGRYLFPYALFMVVIASNGCTTWTGPQAALAYSSSALLVVDWAQTRGIVQDCREWNPVLGPCGERLSPGVYFPLVIGANLLLAHLLPAGWREGYLGVMTGVEGATVGQNYVNQ